MHNYLVTLDKLEFAVIGKDMEEAIQIANEVISEKFPSHEGSYHQLDG